MQARPKINIQPVAVVDKPRPVNVFENRLQRDHASHCSRFCSIIAIHEMHQAISISDIFNFFNFSLKTDCFMAAKINSHVTARPP